MTKHEAYSRLIKLAAEIAQAKGMISPYWDDHKWYASTPLAERRRLIKLAENADSQCKDWAIRLRDAADAIRTPNPETKP